MMEYLFAILALALVVQAQSQRSFKPWQEWTACSATCGRGTQQRKRECEDGTCVQKETRGCQIVSCKENGSGTSKSGDPQFKEWGDWSRCSKTCGNGVQERQRECANGRCIQKETKTCRLKTCEGDDSDKWSAWSECSATCGHGLSSRTRQCPVGFCLQRQVKTCYLRACPVGSANATYESWQEWSSCSKTCGLGTRIRVRQCKELDCRETELGNCSLKSCSKEPPTLVRGEWEQWSQCSASCGPGQQTRRRTCTVGVCEQTQTQDCKIADCPDDKPDKRRRKYLQWGKWAPCSVSCGIGTHKRRRKCRIGFCVEVMTKSCFRPRCHGRNESDSFLKWTPWSKCSVTCGSGVRRRTRNCRPPSNCVQTATQSCFPIRCGVTVDTTTDPKDPFHNWESWSPCSVTCGLGEESRKRRCKFGNCVETAKRTCRRKSCLRDPVTKYGQWSQWSVCSATCGAGEARRTRSYSDGTSTQNQLKYCNNRRCPTGDDKYENWLEWSGCSVSCDSGIRTRIRLCKVGSCRDTQTKPCKDKECIPPDLEAKYGQWQTWGECSATCGFGFSHRKRYCKVGICEQTSSKTCRLKACPTEYTNWEPWGECSVTCGSGISIRKRYCTVGSCEQTQQTICSMEKCGTAWEDWAEWQACTKSCGGGFSYRIRKCKEPLPSDKCPGDNYDYRTCNTHSCVPGVWGPWSDWEDCQVTCGTGTTARIRICEEGDCAGEDKETKPCSTTECIKAHWSKWSEYGKCSVTCGKGQKTRSRTCVGGKQWDEGCLGSLLMTEPCEESPCVKARWSRWSPWRPCSVTCGRGKSNRQRVCIGGEQGDVGCRGKTTQTQNCNRPQCVKAKWQKWSDWTPCTDSCGGGIRSRTRVCSNGKMGDIGCKGEDAESELCNIDDCPPVARWKNWSEWGTCSSTCGGGTTSRTRVCLEGKIGEPDCIGQDRQSKPCGTGKCPIFGKWSEWSKWSKCSVTCGIGTILRSRTCQGDDDECIGDDNESDICTMEDCSARWGVWSDWSVCSSTCGSGLIVRLRECEGGRIGDVGCEDGGQESQECKVRECGEAPPPTKSQATPSWLTWTDWSACPVTCDTGTQSRTRTCTREGMCEGKSEEARSCNTHECPTEAPNQEGRWSEWQEWGDCPVPCGTGISRRIRVCIGGTVEKGGCSGRRTQHRRCKRENCKWSDWGDFGGCSVTCGKGTRKRTRECADGAMEVTKCVGTWIDVTECKAQACPFDPNVICPNIARPRNSDVLASAAAPYRVGAALTFICDVGYEARGDGTITCEGDGRWSGPAPYCAATICSRDLPRVPKGQTCFSSCVNDDDCTEIASKCVCDDWCGKSCVDPDAECEPLTLPENGYIVGNTRTYGYTVTYGCNDGYILVGTPTRTCRSDGRWSGLPIKCRAYNTPGIAGDVGNLFGQSVERVIKGDDANIGAWPWQALLMANRDQVVSKTLETMLAGGSVINKNWILTASHVLQRSVEPDWKQTIVIGLGITTLPQKNTSLPDYAQLYKPDVVIMHSKFDRKTFDYDIALIKVGNRLKVEGELFVLDNDATHGEIIFNEYVRPVALPCISACDLKGKELLRNGIYLKELSTTECVRYGRKLRSGEDNVAVTGYGDKSRNTPVSQQVDIPDALQQAPLKLLKSNKCVEGVNRIRQDYKSARFTARMLCTGSEEGRDACQGDSGGPLIKQVTTEEGDVCWVQLGIISWGWGCANKDEQNVPYPGYYADTSSLMPWLVKTIEDNS